MAQILKKADGKYLIRASKGSGPNRVYDNATFHGTLREARDEARDMEILLSRGKMAGVRFEKCVEVWIRAIRPRLAPRTVDGYDASIRLYASTLLNAKKLGKITREDIQDVYNACGKLSPTTIANLHAALNAFFSWCVKRRDIKENPCTLTDRPARVTPHHEVMTFGEAEQFARVCETMPNGVIFQFALETGMRPEEYLGLRWRDLTLTKETGGEAFLQQAVQFNRSGGGYYFKELKTKRSRRRVPFTEAIRRRLITHRREQNEHRLAMKTTWFNHDLVFPNIIGGPYPLNNLTRRFLDPILDKCKFPKHFHLYSLRHSCATILLMLGENPKVVADRLGSSVKMILETYSHVLPHIQEEATNKMGGVMRMRK